jgi:hypothetical protein
METIKDRQRVDRELTTFADRPVVLGNSFVASQDAAGDAKVKAGNDSRSLYLWHRTIRYIERAMLYTRQSISRELLTAQWGNRLLAGTYSALPYGVETWLDLNSDYYSGGGDIAYPLSNPHMMKLEGVTQFVAPQTADYMFQMYCQLRTTDTIGDDYIQLVMKQFSRESNAWLTPLTLGGAANAATPPDSIIEASGFFPLRLARNERVQFGLRNISSSATWCSVRALEVRVSVHKVKLYPSLTHP